jgi:hypothetical protein
MRKLCIGLCLLFVSFNTYSQISLEPALTLQPDEGPFGYGGRGVIFRAEQNFSMTSFGMDLNFPGTIDFHVSVYAVSGTSRGALISETAYPGMTDDGSEFFTLAHAQDFTAGTTYEVILRFSDPGVIFPHYDFNNPGLLPGSGFSPSPEILVLDGSDFDTAVYSNSWLARFQMNASGVVEPSPTTPVPTLSALGIMTLTLAILGLALWNRRLVTFRK